MGQSNHLDEDKSGSTFSSGFLFLSLGLLMLACAQFTNLQERTATAPENDPPGSTADRTATSSADVQLTAQPSPTNSPRSEPTNTPRAEPTSTQRPRPTNTPRPEPEQSGIGGGAAESADEGNRRSVSPDELLSAVEWGGWGGGDDDDPCSQGIPYVQLFTYGGGHGLAATNLGNQITHGQWLIVAGCNYPPGEVVALRFSMPNGAREDAATTADLMGNWFTTWWSLPDEPVGTYSIGISSRSGRLILSFLVSRSTSPTLTVACSVNQPTGSVLLAGFFPGEEILLARYKQVGAKGGRYEFLDFQYVRMDERGSARLSIPNVSALIVAVAPEDPGTLGRRDTYLPGDTGDSEMLVSAFDLIGNPEEIPDYMGCVQP